MRSDHPISLALLASIAVMPAAAGTNDLFEAKTAAEAIKMTSDSILSNATSAERKAKRRAAAASNKAFKAYTRCPSRPRKARRVLERPAHKHEQFEDVLARIPALGSELDALADFTGATIDDIEVLLSFDTVCDEGHNATQDNLEYNQAAPFVAFAPGWDNMDFGAHGTSGDCTAQAAAPEHIHSRSYYGVVIEGLVTNPFILPHSN